MKKEEYHTKDSKTNTFTYCYNVSRIFHKYCIWLAQFLFCFIIQFLCLGKYCFPKRTNNFHHSIYQGLNENPTTSLISFLNKPVTVYEVDKA